MSDLSPKRAPKRTPVDQREFRGLRAQLATASFGVSTIVAQETAVIRREFVRAFHQFPESSVKIGLDLISAPSFVFP
jgi:hypothetical protein